MLMIDDYIRPSSLDEAYELLSNRDNSQVLGGGAFLRLSKKKIDLIIDLYELDLNYIKETENSIEIGAMTTFRDIENSEILKSYFGNVLSHAVKEVVGVQFKNYVTVGGSVYPKYGFSDLITGLLSLDAKVVLYKGGEKRLEDYLKEKNECKDILTKIIIDKEKTVSSFKSMRKSTGDYSTLNVAVSKSSGKYRIAVGARPGVSMLVPKAEEILNSREDLKEEDILRASEVASEELNFGSNYLASGEYRRDICKVLVKRALMEVAR